MGTHLKWLQLLALTATPVGFVFAMSILSISSTAAAVLERRHWCSLLVLGRPDMIDLNTSCFGYTRVNVQLIDPLLTSGPSAVSRWLSVALFH